MRVCEYLPIALTGYENGKLVEVDTTVFEYEYAELTLEQINETLENADIKEHKRKVFTSISDVKGQYFDIYQKTQEEKVKILEEKNQYIDEDSWWKSL